MDFHNTLISFTLNYQVYDQYISITICLPFISGTFEHITCIRLHGVKCNNKNSTFPNLKCALESADQVDHQSQQTKWIIRVSRPSGSSESADQVDHHFNGKTKSLKASRPSRLIYYGLMINQVIFKVCA